VFELRAYTLRCSTSPFFWRIFFEIGSPKLFTLASNRDPTDSLFPEYLGIQACATGIWRNPCFYGQTSDLKIIPRTELCRPAGLGQQSTPVTVFGPYAVLLWPLIVSFNLGICETCCPHLSSQDRWIFSTWGSWATCLRTEGQSWGWAGGLVPEAHILMPLSWVEFWWQMI
jgi:hypothetical protein